MSNPTASSEIDSERHRRREQLVEGENEVLRLIIDNAPLPVILDELARVAERQSKGGLLASVLLLDHDGVHLRHGAAPSLPDAYSRAIDGISIGPRVGSCGTAAYSRKQVIVSDIMTDPLWEDFRELAAEHGLRACWSTPILSASRSVLGTFAIYYRHPAEPEPEDEGIIEILTRTAALAIEHSRAETELAESEEKFRSLSRCAPLGVFMLDAGGAFSYVNPRFIEISGFEYEKTFEYWLETAAGDPELAANWRKVMDARSEHAGEFPIGTGEAARTVSLRVAPMRSRIGEYMGYVGTLEDVSDRVAGEAALQRESSLRRAIEESIPAGIAVVDLQGVQTYVNRAFAEMVGWPAEALLGARAPFVYWPEEERPAIERAFATTMSGGAPAQGFELQFQRRGGEMFPALVSLAPLSGPEGQVAGWVAAVTDHSRRGAGAST